jgi:hypothetical protein
VEKNGYKKFDSYNGSTPLGSGLIPGNTDYPLLIQSSNVQIDEEGHSLYDFLEEGAGGAVKSVNGKTGDVTLVASDVGADESGTATTAVSEHNTNTEAHNDIRLELQRLSGIINDVLDSEDINLDELHEIVAYIKSNSALIAAITVSKVNVADIIDNLTTNVANKPLSAAQGVVIKGLIDALTTSKLDSSKLTEAINTALAEAKQSGKFDGEDGYTPIKGTDYFTETEISSIKASIIAEFPVAEDIVITIAEEITINGKSI